MKKILMLLSLLLLTVATSYAGELKVGDHMPSFPAEAEAYFERPWLDIGNLGKLIFYRHRKTGDLLGAEAYHFCWGRFDDLPFVMLIVSGKVGSYIDNSPTDGLIDSIRSKDHPPFYVQSVAPVCPERWWFAY